MFENTRSLFQNPQKGLTVGMEIHDQRMPYMFEEVDANGTPVKQFILPVNPDAYRIMSPTRANVTQTQSGWFEDNIGNGLQKISLQGVFGYLGTYPGGNGRHAEKKTVDGWGLAMECEAAFLEFYKQFGDANRTDPKQAHVLRFYNFTDKDYFAVQLNKFELAKNTQRRLLYQYDIQMTCLKRLDEPSASEESDLFELPDLQDEKMGLWGSILKGYTQVATGMNAMINDIGAIQSKLAVIRGAVTGFRQGISDFIAAPFNIVSDTIKTVDTVIDAIVSLNDIPHELTDLLRSTKRDLMTLSLMPERFRDPDTASDANQNSTSTVTEIMTAKIPAGNTDPSVVAMDIPETTLFATQGTAQEVAVSDEPINGTDTIETIALRTLGNAAEWKRIAMLNKLESPYIVKDPMEQFTPVTASGTVAAAVPAGSTSMELTAFSPADGEVLVFGSADKTAIVSRVDGITVYFESELPFDVAKDTTITLHERKLDVLMEGDKILIPSNNSTSTAIIASSDADLYNRLYGTDESLDETGVQSADAAGGIGTVSGIDNLAMQLRHRLMTVKGELPRHPTYGSYLPKIIGKISTDFWLERSILEAKITMLEDPRVRDVGSVTLTAEGTAVYLAADVYPINQTAATQMNLLVA